MSSGDDWLGDGIDWDEGAEQRGSGPPPPPPRVGLIPGAGPAAGAETPVDEGRLAAIRRRRIVALAALGLVFVLALVIPLVVFGGGGGGTALETTTPATTARTTAPARTTTQQQQQTTTITPTTTSPETLHVTLSDGQALNRGDRGSEVVTLQKGLAALGFAAGNPDGVFGATTEAAVVDFQQSNNLTPDGVVGTDTARLLNSALASKSATG